MLKMNKEAYIKPKTVFFQHSSIENFILNYKLVNFKPKIQANYQIYKGLMLLNIWSKYQSLLILNAKIIDATQKKL